MFSSYCLFQIDQNSELIQFCLYDAYGRCRISCRSGDKIQMKSCQNGIIFSYDTAPICGPADIPKYFHQQGKPDDALYGCNYADIALGNYQLFYFSSNVDCLTEMITDLIFYQSILLHLPGFHLTFMILLLFIK